MGFFFLNPDLLALCLHCKNGVNVKTIVTFALTSKQVRQATMCADIPISLAREQLSNFISWQNNGNAERWILECLNLSQEERLQNDDLNAIVLDRNRNTLKYLLLKNCNIESFEAISLFVILECLDLSFTGMLDVSSPYTQT